MFYNLEGSTLKERAEKSNELLQKAVLRASKSRYAKRIDSPKKLNEWVMTDKVALREFGHEMRINRFLPSISSYSGGTTGIPVKLRLSLETMSLEQALIDTLCDKADLDWYDSKIAVMRGDDAPSHLDTKNGISHIESNGGRLHLFSNRLKESRFPNFLLTIQKYRPEILWVYPSVLSQFIRLLDGREHLIKPKLIFSSSEVLMSDLFRKAGKIFPDTKIIDFYGQAERACAAYALKPEEYYFVAGYGFVELFFERNEGDEDLYQIIATPYWNKSFGLVRLRTGDLARVPRGTDEKGLLEISLGFRSFLGISGRTGDFLLSPFGEVLVGIDHIHKGSSNIEQLQFVQKSLNRVDIFVIPISAFGLDDERELIVSARKKIPLSIELKVRVVQKLRVTDSGKVPFIIRENCE